MRTYDNSSREQEERNKEMEIDIGRLTRDPELRSYDSGTTVCYLSLALLTARKDKNGEKVSEFRNISVFGKQGEACARYLKKGSPILYQGELTIKPFIRKDGTPGASGNVTAHEVKFLNMKMLGEEGEQVRSDETEPDDLAGFQTLSDDDIPF